MTTATGRKADHPVSEIFTNRWSPRAFTGEPIPDATLHTILEAGRWAPSANNFQPWRFIYVKRGEGNFDGFLNALNPGNQVWCKNAAALVCVATRTTNLRDGNEVPWPTHALDAGAAWMAMALQATMLGWHVHDMIGFNQEATRQALNVPQGLALDICFAVGRQGAKELLPEQLAARETPSAREPLSKIAFRDRM